MPDTTQTGMVGGQGPSTCVHVCAFLCACMHACVCCRRKNACMHARAHMRTCTCVHKHACMCLCAHAYMNAYVLCVLVCYYPTCTALCLMIPP